MVKTRIAKGKLLKKSWYSIVSTKAFDSAFLGEGYVGNPELLMGNHLTINLANLTGDMKQQGISLNFLINEVSDNKGVAKVIGYEASPSHLRRMIRRGVERMDDVIFCETSDKTKIKVNVFGVTRTSTSKYKVSLIRKFLRNQIPKEVSNHTFDDLIKNVISNKLQFSLKTGVKNIYPLKALEFKKLKVLNS